MRTVVQTFVYKAKQQFYVFAELQPQKLNLHQGHNVIPKTWKLLVKKFVIPKTEYVKNMTTHK